MRKFDLMTAIAALSSLGLASCQPEGDDPTTIRSGELHSGFSGPTVADAFVEFEVSEDGAVEYRVETSGLPEGEVVSVWLGGFNRPERCSMPGGLVSDVGQCGLGDWIAADTYEDTQIFWKLADSKVMDESGVFVIETIDDTEVATEFGPQLDFDAAEIHIWIRTHGPPIEGRLEEQLTNSVGGCDVNVCTDLQVAILPLP